MKQMNALPMCRDVVFKEKKTEVNLKGESAAIAFQLFATRELTDKKSPLAVVLTESRNGTKTSTHTHMLERRNRSHEQLHNNESRWSWHMPKFLLCGFGSKDGRCSHRFVLCRASNEAQKL